MNCTACGATLLPDARFCTSCGAKVGAAPEPPLRSPALPPSANQPVAAGPASRQEHGQAAPRRSAPSLARVGEYLVWNLHPGQVACMLTPAAIDRLPGIRGVLVHEGTRAIAFADGAVVADLRSGVFDFRPDDQARPAAQAGRPAQGRGGLGMFMAAGTALASRVLGRASREPAAAAAAAAAAPPPTAPPSAVPPAAAPPATAAGKRPGKPLISVLLVRQGPLPVVIALQGVATASATSEVVLQVMVEIVDPLAFHRALLQVRRELGLSALSVALTPVVESALRAELAGVKAEAIVPDPALERRLVAAIGGALAADWAFMRVVRLVRIATRSGEIERLRRFRDANYFSERALEQISARNEFANRLRLEGNRQRIQEAADARRLRAALQEIDRDGLVDADELARFELLLDHGRRLREAATEEQYQEALAGLRRSELVREDGLALLERERDERDEDHGRRRLQALELFDLSRQLETDQARLQWEYEVGDQRIALELDRKLREYVSRYQLTALAQQEQRLRDEYDDQRQRQADERAAALAEAQDHREHGRGLAQLELARLAQALTEERLRQAHDRELAAKAQAARDGREADLVAAQRWAGMSAEQIMAANPTLTPAAATALAAKYQAEAAGQPAPASAAAASGELREFMARQLATMQELMRQTVAANAALAGALAGDGGRPAAAADGDAPRFCSHCGRRLAAGACPAGCPA